MHGPTNPKLIFINCRHIFTHSIRSNKCHTNDVCKWFCLQVVLTKKNVIKTHKWLH